MRNDLGRVVVWLVALLALWAPAVMAQDAEEPLDRLTLALEYEPHRINPLVSDSSSNTLSQLIFDSLLVYDGEKYKPHLASTWEMSEEIYFQLNPSDKRTATQVADLLRAEQAKRADEKSPLGDALRNIAEISVDISHSQPHALSRPQRIDYDDGWYYRSRYCYFTAKLPDRVKLKTRTIDSDILRTLEPLLGKDYFSFKTDPSEVVLDEGSPLKPEQEVLAAEFCPPVERNPVFVFHLRHGVQFHDGHEFDSGDVIFTYNAFASVRSYYMASSDMAELIANIKTIKAVDRYTVRAVMRRLNVFDFNVWTVGILPEHLLNDAALSAEAIAKGNQREYISVFDSDFNKKPVGCGPFRLGKWEERQSLQLVRFDNYWDGRAEFKEIGFRFVGSAEKRLAEFKAGRLDLLSANDKGMDAFQWDYRFQTFTGPSRWVRYIAYDQRNELFKDARVRRALSMAIDLDKLAKGFKDIDAEPQAGFFWARGEQHDANLKPIACNPAAARRLLAAAGWKPNAKGILEKDGRTFKLTLQAPYDDDDKAMVQTIAKAWQDIGIDAEFIQVPIRSLRMQRNSARTGAIRDNPEVGGYDISSMGDLSPFFLSGRIMPKAVLDAEDENKGGYDDFFDRSQGDYADMSPETMEYSNFTGYSDPKADELMVRIREQVDPKKRAALSHDLERMLVENQPMTMLYHPKVTTVMNKRIVIVRRNEKGEVVRYEKIKPDKDGSFGDILHWTKVRELPAGIK